jgi:hypothetical protein
MKRILMFLGALVALASAAQAQLPPAGGLSVGNTPIQNGTNGLCLYQTGGKLGEQACGTGTAADIKVGTTTVSSGTTTRILFDNAGTLGEYSLTGSGTVVAMQTAPTFLTSITHGAGPATLTSPAAAKTQLGAADAAAPVPQTLSVQSAVAGTSNAAGANFTQTMSQGTGTGVGGSWILQVAPAGGSGAAQNALATALTIDSTKLATFAGSVTAVGTITGGVVASTDYVESASTSALRVSGRFQLKASADGVVSLNNAGLTDFGRLQFGGTTSSFPAIKRRCAPFSP